MRKLVFVSSLIVMVLASLSVSTAAMAAPTAKEVATWKADCDSKGGKFYSVADWNAAGRLPHIDSGDYFCDEGPKMDDGLVAFKKQCEAGGGVFFATADDYNAAGLGDSIPEGQAACYTPAAFKHI